MFDRVMKRPIISLIRTLDKIVSYTSFVSEHYNSGGLRSDDGGDPLKR